MAGDLINLRAARKQAQRAKARADGDANAAKFGRTKGAKAREAAEADKARTFLDGHRRDEGPLPDQDD